MALIRERQQEFILKGAALQAVKTLVFTKRESTIKRENDPEFPIQEIVEDEAIKTSVLGTPIFSNLEIPAGSFVDLDGNAIAFQGLTLDTVLFRVTQSKNIVTTAVQGRNGTVKEYVSDGDFSITIDGMIVSEDQNTYPEVEVTKLLEIVRVPEQVRIISEFLDFFDISDVVIEGYDIPQQRGFRNMQPFSLRMISDEAIDSITLTT